MNRRYIFSISAAMFFGTASCVIRPATPEPTSPAEVSWVTVDTPTPPVSTSVTRGPTLTPEQSTTPVAMSSPTSVPLSTEIPAVSPTSPGPSQSVLSSTPTWTPTPSVEPTFTPTVTIREETTTILTYQYQQALYTGGDFPYPRLDWSRVAPPIPVAYDLVVLENRCLRVSVLPELGGRVYQCIYKPTGQPLFYNNRVIKPTHWGPEEIGWWLAAGGIEWAFPVEEHGYLSAEPWDDATRRRDGGGATVTLANMEKTRHLQVSVSISLLPEVCFFEIAPRIENPGESVQSYQFWLNALLAPGGDVSPGTRFTMPAQEAYVHSSGDSSFPAPGGTVPWPQESGLAYYASWPVSWLGLFFAPLEGNIAEVYNETARIGLRREFDVTVTPGLKLFAFGIGFDPGNYTDDHSRYVELWGGVTPDFWTYTELRPGQVVAWSEQWQVVTERLRP